VIGMKVAFLGPKTSFSHEAVLKVFPKADLLEVHSIPSVFSSVESKEADFGIVPLENSTEGSVNATLDLLIQSDLKISGELFVDVAHCLLSKQGSSITRIYSHPQAFAQCQQWLQKNCPKAELADSSSTASAAELASREPGSAAIASKASAKEFGLGVVAKNIQDLGFNKTRFIVLGFKEAKPNPKNKTAMVFSAKNKPGALFDALKSFKVYDVNLTKLESRPSKKGNWEYLFFVEFDGDLTEARIQKALAELKEHTDFEKAFGSYPKIGD